MSASAMVTEREARQRERAAFRKGAAWRYSQFLNAGFFGASIPDAQYEEAANAQYPLPLRTARRLREFTDSFDTAYRFNPALRTFEYKHGGTGGVWRRSEKLTDPQRNDGNWHWLMTHLAKLDDLRTDPWETVQVVDDGSAA